MATNREFDKVKIINTNIINKNIFCLINKVKNCTDCKNYFADGQLEFFWDIDYVLYAHADDAVSQRYSNIHQY